KFSSMPIVIQLELTNLCNLSCQTCAHSYWDVEQNKPKFLTLDLVKRYDFLYPTCSEILLGGYGEPLLNKNFLDILSWAKKDPNKIVTIITNGILLETKMDCLRDIDIVTFSMDGIHQVYEEHRETSFTKFHRNLELFRKVYPKKRIHINVVWNKKTHENLFKMVDFLKDYHVEQINLLVEKIYSQDRKDQCLFDARDLHQIHMDLQELKHSTVIKINHPNFFKAEQDCNQPLDSIFILADGEIMACCSAIFKGNDERFSLGYFDGKIKEEFQSFMNQEKMIEYRKARLQGKNYSALCQDCSFRKLQLKHLDRSLDN
ncbi:radical SAM protein, partial [bacterium]|nr:radical SAM protein [bacterium]